MEGLIRFLNLDLDFFLSENTYCNEDESQRLGSKYKPWSATKVRHFLEKRCGLSTDDPVQGLTVESHDELINFWHTLIDSGGLKVPFEVIHIDAHPDMWVGDGLYLTPGFLYVESERLLSTLQSRTIHSGNYLSFAIAMGWVDSLVWVHLRNRSNDLSNWDADARSISTQFQNLLSESHAHSLTGMEKATRIPYKSLSWQQFKTREVFNYIALSKSPNFTPVESDALIPIIETYIRQK